MKIIVSGAVTTCSIKNWPRTRWVVLDKGSRIENSSVSNQPTVALAVVTSNLTNGVFSTLSRLRGTGDALIFTFRALYGGLYKLLYVGTYS